MRAYELMTIFRPEMAETDVTREVERVESALADRGAEITVSDFWGKRRFAYEIDDLNEGYYAVTQFKAEAGSFDDIERALRLSDQVMRHKIVRMDGE